MKIDLSPQVQKYFWGDNLSELNWESHQKYIVQTLLEKGDVSALKWLFQQINFSEVKKLLPTLKLSPKSNTFWKIYLT